MHHTIAVRSSVFSVYMFLCLSEHDAYRVIVLPLWLNVHHISRSIHHGKKATAFRDQKLQPVSSRYVHRPILHEVFVRSALPLVPFHFFSLSTLNKKKDKTLSFQIKSITLHLKPTKQHFYGKISNHRNFATIF